MQVDADEDSFENDGDGRWPFRCFVDQLMLDMFDPGELSLVFPDAFYSVLDHQLIVSP